MPKAFTPEVHHRKRNPVIFMDGRETVASISRCRSFCPRTFSASHRDLFRCQTGREFTQGDHPHPANPGGGGGSGGSFWERKGNTVPQDTPREKKMQKKGDKHRGGKCAVCQLSFDILLAFQGADSAELCHQQPRKLPYILHADKRSTNRRPSHNLVCLWKVFPSLRQIPETSPLG